MEGLPESDKDWKDWNRADLAQTPEDQPSMVARISGKFAPGSSGNPKGRPGHKSKVVTKALQGIFDKLSDSECQAWALGVWKKAGLGDVAAFREVCDRVEGKVPQGVGMDEELGPVRHVFAWDVRDDTQALPGPDERTIEHE